MLNTSHSEQREKRLVAALILVGVLVRLLGLGSFPGGVNQDEASSAYEAYCLLADGMDSWGYRYPVYLTVWGSGQNALQSYLLMPLIALFGLKAWAVRLPLALSACAALPVMYLLLLRLFDRRTARIGLAFLAICPWHITMARWALESNFAPGLILLGMLFFVMGTDNPKYYLAGGLTYGLCLYAYATIWVVLPFLILLHAAYLGYVGRLRVGGWLLAGTLVLGLMALPLLAFLAVNWGILPEIRTAFFSIPRLPQMRGSEVSLSNLYENIYRMVKTFLTQRDGMIWNATDEFGLYYHISLPFMAVGGVVCLVRTVRSLRTRSFDGCALIFAWLVLGVIQGCLIDGNINRLNFLHFPIILCIVLGIGWLCGRLKGKLRLLGRGIAAAYALCFVLFVGHYFTAYQQQVNPRFDAGLREALAYAQTVTDGEIAVDEEIVHSKILFYGEIDPKTFRETVEWGGGTDAFRHIRSVDRYRFGVNEDDMTQGVCIVRAAALERGRPDGAKARVFDSVAVVHGADPR